MWYSTWVYVAPVSQYIQKVLEENRDTIFICTRGPGQCNKVRKSVAKHKEVKGEK